MYNIAMIGAGRRVAPLAKQLIQSDDFQLTAICDTDVELAQKRFAEIENVNYYQDAKEMLEKKNSTGCLSGPDVPPIPSMHFWWGNTASRCFWKNRYALKKRIWRNYKPCCR